MQLELTFLPWASALSDDEGTLLDINAIWTHYFDGNRDLELCVPGAQDALKSAVERTKRHPNSVDAVTPPTFQVTLLARGSVAHPAPQTLDAVRPGVRPGVPDSGPGVPDSGESDAQLAREPSGEFGRGALAKVDAVLVSIYFTSLPSAPGAASWLITVIPGATSTLIAGENAAQAEQRASRSVWRCDFRRATGNHFFWTRQAAKLSSVCAAKLWKSTRLCAL